MKLKNALVLVVLAGAVLAATAQGISHYGQSDAAPAPASFVLKAWSAGGSLVDGLVAGDESEQNVLLLAGLALLATIVRRSVRRNN
jgi:hypothetical protein